MIVPIVVKVRNGSYVDITLSVCLVFRSGMQFNGQFFPVNLW